MKPPRHPTWALFKTPTGFSTVVLYLPSSERLCGLRFWQPTSFNRRRYLTAWCPRRYTVPLMDTEQNVPLWRQQTQVNVTRSAGWDDRVKHGLVFVCKIVCTSNHGAYALACTAPQLLDTPIRFARTVVPLRVLRGDKRDALLKTERAVLYMFHLLLLVRCVGHLVADVVDVCHI